MEYIYFFSLLFIVCSFFFGLQVFIGQGWVFREFCEFLFQVLGQWFDIVGLGGECSYVKVFRGWGKDQVLGSVGSLGFVIFCWVLGLLIFKQYLSFVQIIFDLENFEWFRFFSVRQKFRFLGGRVLIFFNLYGVFLEVFLIIGIGCELILEYIYE